MVLSQEFKEEYGKEMFNLLLETLQQVEDRNPSGRYPVYSLWDQEAGKKMLLSEALPKVLKTYGDLETKYKQLLQKSRGKGVGAA